MLIVTGYFGFVTGFVGFVTGFLGDDKVKTARSGDHRRASRFFGTLWRAGFLVFVTDFFEFVKGFFGFVKG